MVWRCERLGAHGDLLDRLAAWAAQSWGLKLTGRASTQFDYETVLQRLRDLQIAERILAISLGKRIFSGLRSRHPSRALMDAARASAGAEAAA